MKTLIFSTEGLYNRYHNLYVDNDILYFDTAGEEYGVGKIGISQLKLLIEQYEERNPTISILRSMYFALRDRLHEQGSTGYSKVELHELAKTSIFPKLVEQPENFNNHGKDQKGLSVTWLSEKGWQSFIEEFKLFAAENFNSYL